MSSPDNLSKRERQKQRREAKLAQQRAAEANARRKRIATFAVLGLILAALIGTLIAREAAERREIAEREERVQAKLDELGCTPDEKQEDLGGGHIEGAQLAANPPDALYPDRPTASGRHFGGVVKTGVYDVQIDERILVHNLEHAYVNVYYTEDAPEEQVAELKEFAQQQIDGNYKKIIVAPWEGEFTDTNANFAFTAWHFRQTCEQFDTEVLASFLDAHHGGAGEAPEPGAGPHLAEGQGVVDPKGEPFLLPPLGDAESGAQMGDSPTETTEPATESTS